MTSAHKAGALAEAPVARVSKRTDNAPVRPPYRSLGREDIAEVGRESVGTGAER